MTSELTPNGLHTITPYLVVNNVRNMITYLKKVYETESRGEIRYREDGTVRHAEIKIGDSVLMLAEPTIMVPPMPTMLYTYVANSDDTYRKAVSAGAMSVSEPRDHPHGDRCGAVKDVFGNIWWIAQKLRDR
ncbi:VOC family protein [Marinicella sp. W31]|uniref:VOC family protein n=1 Tax=Marinicella sp. W31 TaxID=3023713 RepID=UPI003757C4A2